MQNLLRKMFLAFLITIENFIWMGFEWFSNILVKSFLLKIYKLTINHFVRKATKICKILMHIDIKSLKTLIGWKSLNFMRVFVCKLEKINHSSHLLPPSSYQTSKWEIKSIFWWKQLLTISEHVLSKFFPSFLVFNKPCFR